MATILRCFLVCHFVALFTLGCADGPILNDVHSQLNPTRVSQIFYPTSTEDVVKIVKQAKAENRAVSISGSRHAMGGQQFGRDTFHISTSKMNDVLSFDRKKGIIRAEAGIEWPDLVQYLLKNQTGETTQWAIVQKQTGADKLSLGGALAANIHGRGIRFKPIIQDVEAFTLVNAEGEVLNVSRTENPELFRLAIGGYGLFGVITTIDLRLMHRVKLQRVVEVVQLDALREKVSQRFTEGFLYGDFQYKTDEQANDFMRVGVFSSYRPIPLSQPMPATQKRLSKENWYDLMVLAHR